MQCTACGATQTAFGEEGPGLVVLARDVGGMLRLLEGELDEVRCEACGQPLGITATLTLLFRDEPTCLFAPGSGLPDGGASLREAMRATAEQLGAVMESLPDAAALRACAGALLKGRLKVINQLAKASLEDGEQEFYREHWRDFTPEVFAAACVCAAGAVPGAQLATMVERGTESPAPGIEPFLHAFGISQATVLLVGLCGEATEGTSPHPLEEELVRYVDDGPVLPGTLQTMQTAIESLSEQFPHARAAYCREALLASVCLAAGQPNPRADWWGEVYFGLALEAEDDARYASLVVSDERAARTIGFTAAWDAIARRLRVDDASGDAPPRYTPDQLDRVAARAGHPDLVGRVITQGIFVQAKDGIPLETAVSMMEDAARSLADRGGDPLILLDLLSPVGRLLLEHGQIDDIVALADAGARLMGGGHEAVATADAWLGEFLKEGRQPQRFIDRVESTERGWEDDLGPSLRARLWTERANALRLLGERDEALRIYLRIRDDLLPDLSENDRRVALHNVGILQRETGAPDASLQTLLELAAGIPPLDPFRIGLLASLAVTYSELGRSRDAVRCCEEALPLCRGPWAHEADRFRALLASYRTTAADPGEAARMLEELARADTPPHVLVSAAASWYNLHVRLPSAAPPEKLRTLLPLLQAAAGRAREDGDVAVVLSAMRAEALLRELVDPAGAAEAWFRQWRAAEELEQPHEPETLVALAHDAYRAGNPAVGEVMLRQVPAALAARVGRVRDLSSTTEGFGRFRARLAGLADTVLFDDAAGADWRDARLVAELARDTVGRARAQGEGGAGVLDEGLPDEVLATLAPRRGVLAVVEWVGTREFLGSFVTTISSSGQVESQWLELPDGDLDELAEMISARLRGWHSLRPGDPFDLDGWQVLSRTLCEQVRERAGPDAHLVFLETPDVPRLPWHVAVSALYPASYAAGWSGLLAMREPPERASAPVLGVAMVPRFGEAEPVRSAMERSLARTRAFARTAGLSCETSAGAECDRAALRSLTARVDVLKLLCHGFVAPDGEVALMTAADGGLPLADSVASGSSPGARHRLSWKELQTLPRSPAAVFSAACSTGRTRLAASGDRLGFGNALRLSGTRSVVAPHWDITATEVIPVLDDALERYVSAGGELGQCLFDACGAAARRLPRWMAWSLALEGDWR
jgi:tetratricopeptide (TPR) repeat protein